MEAHRFTATDAAIFKQVQRDRYALKLKLDGYRDRMARLLVTEGIPECIESLQVDKFIKWADGMGDDAVRRARLRLQVGWVDVRMKDLTPEQVTKLAIFLLGCD